VRFLVVTHGLIVSPFWPSGELTGNRRNVPIALIHPNTES